MPSEHHRSRDGKHYRPMTMEPFNNYVTPKGARGVKRCVMDRTKHNVKKRYDGGGRVVKNLSKKRYVIVEEPLLTVTVV